VIHNLYTDTIDNLKTAEDFKQKLTENLLSQTATSFTTKKNKKLFKKTRTLAFASILVVVGIVAGVFGGIFLNHQNTTSTLLPPHFNVNGRVYWTQGDEINKLPPNYKPVGKILSYGEENFQSNFGGIGYVIYMDPSNPYAAYLDLKNDNKKSISYLPTDVYQLFVTNDIRFGSIYYNGNLYNNYINSVDDFQDSKCVGTIKSVDCLRLPSHDFETNILNTLGCKVYASETDQSILYIVQNDGGRICLKLNFH
jgi:hypothetical protein